MSTWDDDGDSVASFVRCCYGAQGDEPGTLAVHVQTDGKRWRWVERDDSGDHDTGGPFATRAEAEAAGVAYAEGSDETPDLDGLVSDIMGTGYFRDVDVDDVKKLCALACGYASSQLLLTRDLPRPLALVVASNNSYLDEVDYVAVSADYDAQHEAAHAILAAITSHQS